MVVHKISLKRIVSCMLPLVCLLQWINHGVGLDVVLAGICKHRCKVCSCFRKVDLKPRNTSNRTCYGVTPFHFGIVISVSLILFSFCVLAIVVVSVATMVVP